MTDPSTESRARFYNPGLRRFVSQDPIWFAGGLNWYAYANGNPISLIDPFGLSAVGDYFRLFREFSGRFSLG